LRVLTGEVAKRFRQITFELALEKDWDVLALEVAADHVHLFIEHQPDIAINQIVKAFKGRTLICYECFPGIIETS
jgi:putative transposase